MNSKTKSILKTSVFDPQQKSRNSAYLKTFETDPYDPDEQRNYCNTVDMQPLQRTTISSHVQSQLQTSNFAVSTPRFENSILKQVSSVKKDT